VLGVNDGQRLLVETGASLGKIAGAAGCSKGTAQRWKRGETIPRLEARLAMRDAFGIDPDAWDTELPRGFAIKVPPRNKAGRPRAVKPAAELDAKPKPKPKKAAPKPARAPREIPPYPDAPEAGAGTVVDVRYLLVCIRHDLQHRELTAGARSKLRSDEARTIALVAKIEREEELKEDRYVRNHPAFREHCDRILGALKPYPEAAQAVIDAMA